MSTERLKGRDLVLFRGEVGYPPYDMVAMATDASLNVTADIKETTNPLSGRAKCYKAGRYSWTMDVARLYMVNYNATETESSSTEETNILQQGETVAVGLATRDELFAPESGQYRHLKRYYGTAIVKSVQVNAPVNGMANYRVSFQGTGELTAQGNAYRNLPPPRPES